MDSRLKQLALPSLVFASNLLVLVTATGRSAPTLAAIGCVASVVMPRKRVPLLAWFAAALLLAPLALWRFAPQIGFLRVDQRAQLAFAWLILATVLWLGDTKDSSASHRSNGRPVDLSPLVPGMLFVLWSAILWFIFVWDIGVGRVVTIDRNAIPSNCGGDILAWIFGAWDTHSVSNHLFLPWRTPADYASRTVYVNHSQAYLIAMYAAVKSLQTATGEPLYYAINLTPFLYMAASVFVLAVLLTRTGLFTGRVRFRTLLWLFLLLGTLMTQSRFWRDLYLFTGDDPFPLVGAGLILLLAMMREPKRPALAALVAGLLGALNPFTAPAVLLALVCLQGQPASTDDSGAVLARNKSLVWICTALTIGALTFFVGPRLLITLAGYKSLGSSFMYRAGLDGDARYVTSVWQAIVAPCTSGCCGGGRTLGNLLLPAFVPLTFAAVLSVRDNETIRSLGRALAFVVAPYLLSAILFAQAVSLHPYFYDHLLLMPITILGVAAMLSPVVQGRLRGAVLLAGLLLFAGMLMSNLMAIAQAFAR